MLRCENVAVSYEGTRAVEDVSFSIIKGDYLCIVGENGSGKSSLMKAVLGLIAPSGGSIHFDGVKQNEIGYLPQQTVVQKDFPASVFEVVLSGCLGRQGLISLYSRKDKALAQANLDRLGITDLAKQSYRALSGGQQQRVLLARALCATDKLIVLDEPVNGLDPVMTAEMYTLLKQLNDDGVTIAMISHDLPSAVRYGSKILHLRTKPVFFGVTQDYVQTDVYSRMAGGENLA